jgi:hypothetical protein
MKEQYGALFTMCTIGWIIEGFLIQTDTYVRKNDYGDLLCFVILNKKQMYMYSFTPNYFWKMCTTFVICVHFAWHFHKHCFRTTSYRPYLLFYLCILTFIFQQYVILSLQVESIFDITFLSRLQQAMICSSVTETIWETKIDIPEVNSITLHYVFEQMVCNIKYSLIVCLHYASSWHQWCFFLSTVIRCSSFILY